jgi:hypothetical protein
VRFAYADPPYIGCAHYYPENEEVDHAALIKQLELEFPDGWALSLHSPSLKTILPMCPDAVRVMAWVKPFAVFKPNINPAYAWEPVIVRGGRKRTREQDTVRDWIAEGITLQRGMVGVKPDVFCFWLFEVLGMQPGDELVDVFPGTTSVTKAFEKWQRQLWTVTA